MAVVVGPPLLEPALGGGCLATPPPAQFSQKRIGVDDECTALNTAVSALDIYSLCQPARDATVQCSELETVLHNRFGAYPGRPDGKWFPGLLGSGSTTPRSSRKRVDFLTFWLALGKHLAEDSRSPPSATRMEPEGEPQCLLSTIRGMEHFGRGVLELCRNQPRNVMLPSQDLIRVLQEVRACAQDKAYWDEVIGAVPTDQGLKLSLPEIAEAAHVWLKDCVRAEVEGSDLDIVSPLIGSNRTSLVSLPNFSPATAPRDFSTWAGGTSIVIDETSQGVGSVESQLGFGEDAESQFMLIEDSTTPDDALLADAKPVELQSAEEAAEILFGHIDSESSRAAASPHVQDAMRCLSSAHESINRILAAKEQEIKELQESLERKQQVHAEELDKLQRVHEAETSTLLNQLAASRMFSDGSSSKCVLCLDGLTTHASVPCGHLAFCGACAAERPSQLCPVCRQPSQSIVRIFKP